MAIGRILGVDHGDRRTGIAVSDPLGLVARPVSEIRATTDDEMVRLVADCVREHDAARVVVGLPRNMDGSRGPRQASVEAFVDALSTAIAPTPIDLIDERLSTHEAEQRLTGRKIPPRERKAALNREAARVLLQAYLDQRDPA